MQYLSFDKVQTCSPTLSGWILLWNQLVSHTTHDSCAQSHVQASCNTLTMCNICKLKKVKREKKVKCVQDGNWLPTGPRSSLPSRGRFLWALAIAICSHVPGNVDDQFPTTHHEVWPRSSKRWPCWLGSRSRRFDSWDSCTSDMTLCRKQTSWCNTVHRSGAAHRLFVISFIQQLTQSYWTFNQSTTRSLRDL